MDEELPDELTWGLGTRMFQYHPFQLILPVVEIGSVITVMPGLNKANTKWAKSNTLLGITQAYLVLWLDAKYDFTQIPIIYFK